MFSSYFKLAWRNIRKSPFYSLVNIAGLSAGIAFTLLIAAYTWTECRVNQDLKNVNDQYIIQSVWKNPDMGMGLTTFGQLARTLKEQYPRLVANYYRWDGITSNVSKGDKHFREGMQVGDSSLLTMYGFRLLDGNAGTALNDLYSVVITEDMARKYFGKINVVGQTLTIENFSNGKHDFTITGVLQRPARNSVTNVNANNHNEFFLSTAAGANFFGRVADSWNNGAIVSYVQLQKGVSPAALDLPMRKLIKENAGANVAADVHTVLVPLKEYYRLDNRGLVNKMIFTLSAIALFILLMAVINFINLSVSRSSARMKEIGIRKVLGGLKKQLMLQFLSESTLMVLLATLLALGIYTLARPFFSQTLGTEIPSLRGFPAWFALVPLGLVLFTGLLSGIYPALVLAGFRPVESLKGKLPSVKDNSLLRKGLVGFQFCIATIVLIGAIIITQQLDLFFSKDLGYDKDAILYAQLPRDWSPKGAAHMSTIRDEIARMPEVKDVSLSYAIPNGMGWGSFQLYKSGQDSTHAVPMDGLPADRNFHSVYGIPLKAGEAFPAMADTSGNSLHVVLNETAVRALGFKDPKDAIDQPVRIQGSNNIMHISGVIGDFHFSAMGQKIQPMVFYNVAEVPFYRFFSVKLRPGRLDRNIEALRKKWAVLMPGAPFEYNFIDDALKKLYQAEIQLKKASYTATLLAMIIVFLGILALISLSVQKRTKEIGIRKVLGSSVPEIVTLFMGEFLRVIALAALVACPVAWYVMNQWLNDYASRVPITATPFLISISLLALITVSLIGLQTIKAAMANPIKSLRTE